jgi:hypothetical protein
VRRNNKTLKVEAVPKPFMKNLSEVKVQRVGVVSLHAATHITYIGSPPSTEDAARSVPVFPPGTRA